MAKVRERAPFEELAVSFERSGVFPHMHSYDLYRQWLRGTWAFLNAALDQQAFRECLDKYTYDEGAEFGRLLGVYTDAVTELPFQDILGQIFMRLDIKSVQAGQYFTPFHIAEMMARIQFSREDFEAKVAEKGEVSVCDPAVGSGVMLLAFAKVVHDEFGRAGVSKIRFYGTDIDERCVLMCRIQLRMNGLDTFGRMAGLLGAMATADAEATSHRQLTPAVLVESRPKTVPVQEPQNTPDLSNAIILHSEECPKEELAEQLALF